MKKTYIFTILLSILTLIGCDDKLDLSPFDAVSEDVAYSSVEDFNNALKGVYTSLRSEGYYGGTSMLFPDMFSDNLIICSEGRLSYQTYFYWNFGGNSTWTLWDNAYSAINKANYILKNIDNLEDGDTKNSIKGEALALRALCHFDLARVYAKAPAFAGEGDLGVPYVVDTDAYAKPSRPSVSETYTLILADLNDAVGLIEEDLGVGRLNKAAVNAILARVYLYQENWTEAAAEATNAINLGSGTLINSTADFADVWLDETETGVLFKVKVVDADDVTLGTYFSQTSSQGVKSEYVVDYEFYSSFAFNDIRKDLYFSTSDFNGKTFNHIAKYFGRATGNLNVVDAKVIRWSEVYLTRAEAYANLGSSYEAKAIADLDVVRAGRYTNFSTESPALSGNALKNLISEERRKELACEGHRFFDLKRKGLAIQRSSFGDEADGGGDAVPEAYRNMPSQDNKFQLPIPQDEINANENMEQNDI